MRSTSCCTSSDTGGLPLFLEQGLIALPKLDAAVCLEYRDQRGPALVHPMRNTNDGSVARAPAIR